MKLSCEIHCFSTIITGTGSLLVLCNQVGGWPPWEELTHFTVLTLMPLSIQSGLYLHSLHYLEARHQV